MKSDVQPSKTVPVAQFEKQMVSNPKLETLKAGILELLMEVIDDERIDKPVRAEYINKIIAME